MPTARRAPAAFLVRRGGERLLFDCAEGTQRQLQRSSVGLPDLETIFLTHFHADFVSGHIDLAKATGATIIYGPDTVTKFDVHVARDGERSRDQ